MIGTKYDQALVEALRKSARYVDLHLFVKPDGRPIGSYRRTFYVRGDYVDTFFDEDDNVLATLQIAPHDVPSLRPLTIGALAGCVTTGVVVVTGRDGCTPAVSFILEDNVLSDAIELQLDATVEVLYLPTEEVTDTVEIHHYADRTVTELAEDHSMTPWLRIVEPA